VIDNHACTQNFETGEGYDSELGMDFFTGQGMGHGLTFDTESVEIALGSGKDSLAIPSWVGGGNMTVDLGAGDDRLAIGNPDPGFGGLGQFYLSGLTLIGGGGIDRLEFNDSQSYATKTAGVGGRIVSGLMPTGNISLMSDFEVVTLYLGHGCKNISVSNPAVPVSVYSQGATIRIPALGLGGQVRLFGGARPDKLIIGATTATVYVHGSIVYTAGSVTYAMDEEAQYQVNELSPSASLLVNGGPRTSGCGARPCGACRTPWSFSEERARTRSPSTL